MEEEEIRGNWLTVVYVENDSYNGDGLIPEKHVYRVIGGRRVIKFSTLEIVALYMDMHV